MPKNLLNLDGKALEKELDRIVKENPPRAAPWTQKELEILTKLRAKRIPAKKISELLGKSVNAIYNRANRH